MNAGPPYLKFKAVNHPATHTSTRVGFLAKTLSKSLFLFQEEWSAQPIVTFGKCFSIKLMLIIIIISN